jgi:dGTPase
VARLWTAIERRWPRLDQDRKMKALVRDGIGTMVGDVLEETRRRVAAVGASSIADVRSAGRALAGFSEAMADEERALKRFLYDNLYDSPALRPVRDEAQRVVAGLAAAYRADPALLPPGWRHDDSEIGRLRGIGDFIAGMTDRFAIRQHELLVGPVSLPEKF